MVFRKLGGLTLGVLALTLACGCRSSTSYRQPVVVGSAPVVAPAPVAVRAAVPVAPAPVAASVAVPAPGAPMPPAPCCNGNPAAGPAPAPVTQTLPPGYLVPRR